MLLQHRNRWVSFSLCVTLHDGKLESIWQRIPEQLPELRELALQNGAAVYGWAGNRLPKRLVCPKLQVLRLRGTTLYSFNLANSVLLSLSSVTLADIQLGWDDWHAVLHHGSKLVELEIRDVGIVRDGEGVLGTAPVLLPHLQRLALRLLSSNWVATESILEVDAFLSTFFAPNVHTVATDFHSIGTAPPLKFGWDKPLPGLKTLMILNRGGLDQILGVFQRCRHVSYISICNDCVEGCDEAIQVLESLADPTTGPLLDQLATLTLTMVIPTFERWEKFLLGKKLQVYLHYSQEDALRKFIDEADFRTRGRILEKLKTVVPLEVCMPTRDNTWFGSRWRFGGDNE